jgi:hypothetical protein
MELMPPFCLFFDIFLDLSNLRLRSYLASIQVDLIHKYEEVLNAYEDISESEEHQFLLGLMSFR